MNNTNTTKIITAKNIALLKEFGLDMSKTNFILEFFRKITLVNDVIHSMEDLDKEAEIVDDNLNQDKASDLKELELPEPVELPDPEMEVSPIQDNFNINEEEEEHVDLENTLDEKDKENQIEANEIQEIQKILNDIHRIDAILLKQNTAMDEWRKLSNKEIYRDSDSDCLKLPAEKELPTITCISNEIVKNEPYHGFKSLEYAEKVLDKYKSLNLEVMNENEKQSIKQAIENLEKFISGLTKSEEETKTAKGTCTQK